VIYWVCAFDINNKRYFKHLLLHFKKLIILFLLPMHNYMVICSFFFSLVSWSENLQSISVWQPTSINHCAWLHSYVICVWKSEEEETLNLYMFQHMEMVKISVFSLGCQIQILSAISFILPNLSFYLFLQGLHNTPFFSLIREPKRSYLQLQPDFWEDRKTLQWLQKTCTKTWWQQTQLAQYGAY